MKKDYFKLMEERPELFQNTDISGSIHIYTQQHKIEEVEKKMDTKIGVLYQDRYIILVKDAVRHPNGKDGTYIRILYTAKGEGVVILPIWKDKGICKIMLLSHYRHAFRKTYLEVPRGFSEDSLSEQENIHKETFEETGCEISGLTYLGQLASDTGLVGGEVKAYAVYLTGEPKVNDKKESIRKIELLSLEKIELLIREGLITDGYTLSVLALGQAVGII